MSVREYLNSQKAKFVQLPAVLVLSFNQKDEPIELKSNTQLDLSNTIINREDVKDTSWAHEIDTEPPKYFLFG